MKFLDQASLPKDLQGGRAGAAQKVAAVEWLDVAKLPSLPIGDAFIDGQLALTLTFTYDLHEALRRHSQAAALDHFIAELCRQVPAPNAGFGMCRFVAEKLGGPETASVLARAIRDNPQIGYALPLVEIGSAAHIPAIALCLLRAPRPYRKHIEDRLAAMAQRLKLTQADFEDWSLPDDATPAENQALRGGQAARLEKAMLAGRRWTVDVFDRRFARQPIMAPLAATLVWGYFDQAGRLLQAFLIEAAGQYPQAAEEASVGIVHPAHVSAEEAARWREQTKDLGPPFAQFKRGANALAPEDGTADRIPNLPTRTLPAAALLCRLESLGWQRPKSRTRLDHHTRAFPELGLTAVLRYSGIPLEYGGEWHDQSLVDCFFLQQQERLPLSRVSPIAISAVLADLQTIAGGRA